MAFHHKIQAHHHVSIWAVAILSLVAIQSVYTNMVISSYAEDEPSARTKQFFGEEDGGGDRKNQFNPPECQQQQQQQQAQQPGQQQPPADDAAFRARITEHNQLMTQISQLEQQIQSAPPEQQGTLAAQLDQLRARRTELEAQMQQQPGQGQQGQGGPGQPGQQGQEQREQGPSAECKAAIVKLMKSHFLDFRSKINNTILPTFNKVDSTISKIQEKVPALRAAGVDETTIAKINTDIDRIQKDAKTVKSFFNGMLASLNEFLDLADSSPDQAFEKMKNKFSAGGQNSAATAADDLVDAFTDLETTISSLK